MTCLLRETLHRDISSSSDKSELSGNYSLFSQIESARRYSYLVFAIFVSMVNYDISWIFMRLFDHIRTLCNKLELISRPFQQLGLNILGSILLLPSFNSRGMHGLRDNMFSISLCSPNIQHPVFIHNIVPESGVRYPDIFDISFPHILRRKSDRGYGVAGEDQNKVRRSWEGAQEQGRRKI
jgi:hypothetical protein